MTTHIPFIRPQALLLIIVGFAVALRIGVVEPLVAVLAAWFVADLVVRRRGSGSLDAH